MWLWFQSGWGVRNFGHKWTQQRQISLFDNLDNREQDLEEQDFEG
jgi:hypothetical protein